MGAGTTKSDERKPRVLLIVNAVVGDQDLHGGHRPNDRRRTDFGELAAALEASVVDWASVDRMWFGLALRRKFGFGPIAACLAFINMWRYDVVWCFTEIEGLLLAFLFKVFRVRKRLFFIAVEAVSPKSIFFLERLKVWTHFTAMLPTNTYQADAVIRESHVPGDKVVILPYQVDCEYFTNAISGGTKGDRPLVVATGLESRDYVTLVKAVTGLDVEVFVAAASLWSGDSAQFPVAIPSNVTVGRCSYSELRDLYARSSLAVVPLKDTPYQHGITAIQEAMAMGLPVIVTRTIGQSDVIVDRRQELRSNPSRKTKGAFAQLFRPENAELQQSNGFYVAPGDEVELRKCICYLLEHRDVADALGVSGQRFAREVLDVELFVERAVRLVMGKEIGR